MKQVEKIVLITFDGFCLKLKCCIAMGLKDIVGPFKLWIETGKYTVGSFGLTDELELSADNFLLLFTVYSKMKPFFFTVLVFYQTRKLNGSCHKMFALELIDQ